MTKPDVSITFTPAELAELLQWVRLAHGAGPTRNPWLVRKIDQAREHSQAPAHPPELSAGGDVPFWCVVRSDSPDGPAEVQHWTAQRIDPRET